MAIGGVILVKTIKAEAKGFLEGNRISSLIFLIISIVVVQFANYLLSCFSFKTETYDMVLTCIYVFLGYPFLCTVIKYFYLISKNEKRKLSKVLSPFSRSYMTVTYFSFFIYTTLYILKFITISEINNNITLIIKTFGYAALYLYIVMGSFVIAENTDIDLRCFLGKTSVYVIKNVFKILKLTISFVGWFLLGTVTLGIGFLWILPYFLVSFGRLYEHIKDEKEFEQNNIYFQEKEEKCEKYNTEDLSKKEELKKDSPDKTMVFTKEMMEQIKNSQKNN